MMSHRTAMVVGSAPLDGPGGAEACCRALVRLLTGLGFETSYRSAAELIRRTPAARIPGRKLWWSLAEVLAAVRAADGRADITVTNGPVGWGIKGRIASVHYYHGTYVGQADAVRSSITYPGYVKMRYLDGMLERLAGRGKTCVACSDRVRAEVGQWFGHEARTVWLPVDISLFAPGHKDTDLLKRLGIPSGKPVGLFVGAGRPVKGEHAAFEVMRSTGSMISWLTLGERPRTELPAGVILRDRVPPAQMPALLRSVDLVLAPSEYESFSLLIAETLAVGTPIVTSPCAGAAEFLMRDWPLAQWLVDDPHDIRSLVNVVLTIIGDLLTAREVALWGRARVGKLLSYGAWRARFIEATGLMNLV